MPHHSSRRALATCCATHGLHDGLSDINYVLLPILAQAFGLSLVQVGSIRSAWRAATSLFYTLSSVCSLIVPLVFGAIGDVIGITATIALIGLLVSLTLPLCLVLRPALAPHRAVI